MNEVNTESAARRVSEELRVRRWRREQFVGMGFCPRDASVLAKAPVDLGRMRKLVAAGCPLPTAQRILV